MIISEDFVFIHIPKTGGKSFKQFCQTNKEKLKITKFSPNTNMHDPRHQANCGNKKVLAVLRSPLTWYTSFYKHNIYGSSRKSNPKSWTNICRDNTFDEVFNEYFIKDGYAGFYTRQLFYYLSKYKEEVAEASGDSHKIKLENVYQAYEQRIGLGSDSFLRLENIEEDIEREFNIKIDNYPKINTTKKPKVKILLSKDQIEKINQSDKLIFDLIDKARELND